VLAIADTNTPKNTNHIPDISTSIGIYPKICLCIPIVKPSIYPANIPTIQAVNTSTTVYPIYIPLILRVVRPIESITDIYFV
jgi:hypothetical protein